MAARLATWLADARPQPPPASFDEAAANYPARRRVGRPRPSPALARATATRCGRDLPAGAGPVVARRRAENERSPSSWPPGPPRRPTAQPGAAAARQSRGCRREVLAPLGADDARCCSWSSTAAGWRRSSSWRPSSVRPGFREVARTGANLGAGRRLTGIAALPTVTEVSRASLIAGRLDRGNQDHERRAFAANPSWSWAAPPPPSSTRTGCSARRDHRCAPRSTPALGGGGTAAWWAWSSTPSTTSSSGELHRRAQARRTSMPSSPCCDAARTQGRAVVMSADHGHVLAQPDDGGTGTFQGGGDGGERWRTADRRAGDRRGAAAGRPGPARRRAGVLAPWRRRLPLRRQGRRLPRRRHPRGGARSRVAGLRARRHRPAARLGARRSQRAPLLVGPAARRHDRRRRRRRTRAGKRQAGRPHEGQGADCSTWPPCGEPATRDAAGARAGVARAVLASECTRCRRAPGRAQLPDDGCAACWRPGRPGRRQLVRRPGGGHGMPLAGSPASWPC